MRRSLYEHVHEDFRASFRTFLEREVLGDEGRYGEWERNGIVPREVFALAGKGGFLGMAVPDAYGGASAEDFRFNLVIGEETQRAGVGSVGLGMSVHTDICVPYFLTYCSEPQRERWLDGIATGELITAIAMTEPGIGSDLAAMSTSARREGEHYVVDGTKTFITNGINADLVIVAVKTDASERHRGISLLVVERGTEGFERGRNLEKIGQHSQDTAELSFSDMHVPVENLLGEEGEGFRYLVSNLPQERLSIAIAGVAAAAAAPVAAAPAPAVVPSARPAAASAAPSPTAMAPRPCSAPAPAGRSWISTGRERLSAPSALIFPTYGLAWTRLIATASLNNLLGRTPPARGSAMRRVAEFWLYLKALKISKSSKDL